MNLRGSGSVPDNQQLRPLDLSHQETSTPHFRMLQSIHEAFARSLSNALSTFLQSEIEAKFTAGSATNPFSELMGITGTPPVKVWFDSKWPRADSETIYGQLQTNYSVWLPIYLDDVEFGPRVSDYVNSPGEEQMLEDLSMGWLEHRTYEVDWSRA